MDREYHENRSLDLFDGKFTEVHDFLDQFFRKYGPYHRVFLHHKEGIKLVVGKFGEQARPVAEQHIMDDRGHIARDWRQFNIDFQFVESRLKITKKSFVDDLKTLYPDRPEQEFIFKKM